MGRKKPQAPQTTTEYLSALETAIRRFASRHHLFTIFRHFVELSALTFSNTADSINKTAREAQYLTIVKQDTPEEFQQFPPLLGMLVDCLEQEPTDVLGVLYHRLELHNEQRGQFFTPYPVCLAMAKMLVHDAKQLVEEQEFLSAQEPCVGSGAMVIALAQALREEGINYQQCLHVTAIDCDIIAVHMAYVQCTLLHIPALILHGDTLRDETYSVWRTLAHVMQQFPEESKPQYSSRYPVWRFVNIHTIMRPSSAPFRSFHVGGCDGDKCSHRAQTSVRRCPVRLAANRLC